MVEDSDTRSVLVRSSRLDPTHLFRWWRIMAHVGSVDQWPEGSLSHLSRVDNSSAETFSTATTMKAFMFLSGEMVGEPSSDPCFPRTLFSSVLLVGIILFFLFFFFLVVRIKLHGVLPPLTGPDCGSGLSKSKSLLYRQTFLLLHPLMSQQRVDTHAALKWYLYCGTETFVQVHTEYQHEYLHEITP